MMNARYIAGCIAFAALGITSCSTVSNTATTSKIDSQIVNLTVAEMKVEKEKAEKTTEWKWNPFGGMNIEAAKQNAVARLLSETGADVLVEPQYETKSNGMFRGGRVTVTGYPATYTGFHSMTPEEAGSIATLKFPPTTSTTVRTPGVFAAVKKIKQPKISKEKREWHNNSFLNINYSGEWPYGSYHNNVGLTYGHYCKNRWGWYVDLGLNIGDGMNHYGYDFSSWDNNGNWIEQHEVDTHYHSGEGKSCSSSHRHYSATMTVGALFAVSNVFGIYAGTGVGSCAGYERWRYDDANRWESRYEYEDNEELNRRVCIGKYREYWAHDPNLDRMQLAIPLEIGFDFRFGTVNLMVGYTHKFITSSGFDDANGFKLGLGVNF